MLRFNPFQTRGTARPTIPLPLACRSVGHYRITAGWEDRVKRKDFVELFWSVAGTGVFTIDGEEQPLHADQVLVLYSGETHLIRAATDWEYRWMTIDGALADAIAREFALARAPRRAGPCPQGLFERLQREVEDASPTGQRAASALAFEILTLAAAGDEPVATGWDHHVRRCADLIQQGFASADLSVAVLAARLGVDRTGLCKAFKARMKLTPSDYLSSLRLAQALRLLCGSDLPIATVARQTGFASAGYFSSAVRRHTGRSPAEIRRSAGRPGAAATGS